MVVGEWEPTACGGRSVGDLPLNEWVGQALGSASMCWESVGRAGVFDSDRCVEIHDGLMAHLNEVINTVIESTTRAVKAENAPLGLAATRELLHELEVRGATGVFDPRQAAYRGALRSLEVAARDLRTALPPAVLDYRTVGE
jgi:hypothetical protein